LLPALKADRTCKKRAKDAFGDTAGKSNILTIHDIFNTLIINELSRRELSAHGAPTEPDVEKTLPDRARPARILQRSQAIDRNACLVARGVMRRRNVLRFGIASRRSLRNEWYP